jgi:hypothetical protein
MPIIDGKLLPANVSGHVGTIPAGIDFAFPGRYNNPSALRRAGAAV